MLFRALYFISRDTRMLCFNLFAPLVYYLFLFTIDMVVGSYTLYELILRYVDLFILQVYYFVYILLFNYRNLHACVNFKFSFSFMHD